MFRNRHTGQTFAPKGVFGKRERSMWLKKKRLKDFQNMVTAEGLNVSFLTLTCSDVNGGEKYFKQVMDSMRHAVVRAGYVFKFVWVLEVQPKRYIKTGELARHWHIVLASDGVGVFPHAKYHKERPRGRKYEKIRDGSVITFDWLHTHTLQKIGQYFCMDGYSRGLYRYLLKYLEGNDLIDELRTSSNKKIRTFGGSSVAVVHQMTEHQSLEFSRLVSSDASFADLNFHREGSRIVCRSYSVSVEHIIGNVYKKRRKSKVEYVIKGDWVRDTSSSEEVVNTSE